MNILEGWDMSHFKGHILRHFCKKRQAKIKVRKRLFTGRLSGYKKYLTGRLPGYKKYLTDRLSGYKKYLTGRLYLDIKSTSQIHYLDMKSTSQVQFVRKFIHIKPLQERQKVSNKLWKASTSSSTRGKFAKISPPEESQHKSHHQRKLREAIRGEKKVTKSGKRQ